MTWRVMAQYVAVVGVLMCLGSGAAMAGEPPSIQQLPEDLAHLATVWVSVPQTMYAMSRDEGPVVGLTKGTVEGGRSMIEDTARYLTSGYFNGSPNEHRPVGALLHYAF